MTAAAQPADATPSRGRTGIASAWGWAARGLRALFGASAAASTPAALPAPSALVLRESAEPPIERAASSGMALAWGRRASNWEHNRRLQDLRARMVEYRKALTSPPVAVGWRLWLGMATSATWGCTSAPSDDPRAKEAAELVRWSFGLGDHAPACGRSWEATVREALEAQLFGFAVYETTALPLDGRYAMRLHWVAQESVDRWMTAPDETIAGLVQRPLTYGGAGFGGVTLPADRMIHLVWDGCGPNPEGRGILRAIEPLVRDLGTLANLAMVAAQRFAAATPVVRIDLDIWQRYAGDVLDAAAIAAELAKWEAIAADYTSGARAYLSLPPWITMETFGGTGGSDYNPYALGNAMDGYERRILTAFLAQFLVLGVEGGSYSLGQVHAGAAQQAAANALQWLAESMQPAIELLVRWNFGADFPRELMPRLTFEGIRSAIFVERVADLVSLFASGALTPTDADERALRAGLELPALPDDFARSAGQRLLNRAAAPSPAGVTPPAPLPSGGLVKRA